MQIYLPIINEVPALIHCKILKWNKNVLRRPDYKIPYPLEHRFLSSNKPWRKKKSFHHHRKIRIPLFSWGGVGVFLYKVGAFYTIFLSPRASCFSLQMLWMQTFTKAWLRVLLSPYLVCSSFKHAMSSQRRDVICSWQTSTLAAYSQFLHICIWII